MRCLSSRLLLPLAVLGLMAVSANRAESSLQLFTTRAAFDAATSNQTLVDFENPNVGSGYTYYGGSTGSAFSGVTFTEPIGTLYVLGSSVYATSGTTQYLNMNDSGSTATTATFTNPATYAVGMDLGSLYNWGGATNPGSLQISLSNGDTVMTSVAANLVSTSNPMTFFGFISSNPFSGMTITDLSSGLMIDNFAFSSTSAVVPEPATLLSGGLAGLLGFGFWRTRRKVAAAA